MFFSCLPDVPVTVRRKTIRNIYLRVKEPDARLELSVPYHMSMARAELFLKEHLLWVEKQRTRILQRAARFQEENGEAPARNYFGDRAGFEERLSALLAAWQEKIGVRIAGYRLRSMKSRWGSCNVATHMLTFNLQLMYYEPFCLEYVVVHELTHLLERRHNARFWGLVESFLPTYREAKRALRGR